MATVVPGYVTAAQLAETTGTAVRTVRWHCSHRRGLLYSSAIKSGQSWLIPLGSAARYIEHVDRKREAPQS